MYFFVNSNGKNLARVNYENNIIEYKQMMKPNKDKQQKCLDYLMNYLSFRKRYKYKYKKMREKIIVIT